MDSSTFDENQTQFLVFAGPAASPNDQPVDYGPLVFKVMRALSQRLGGVEYLIGKTESLRLSLAKYTRNKKHRFKLADTHQPHDLQTRSNRAIYPGGRVGRVPSWKRKCFRGRLPQKSSS